MVDFVKDDLDSKAVQVQVRLIGCGLAASGAYILWNLAKDY